MSLNKFRPHVYVVPEDRANEQMANGFVMHHQVTGQIEILPCADGWPGVLEKFRTEYIPYLRTYPLGRVVLLIDFDANYESQRERFDRAVPDDLKTRVFVIGALETPELLRKALGKRLEDIGHSLADDCYRRTVDVWNHAHLRHNEPDRLRLIESVNSILFAT